MKHNRSSLLRSSSPHARFSGHTPFQKAGKAEQNLSPPESFPDTHGSPTMGMAFAALAAAVDPASFRSLMADNRWWFTLSRCWDDGTFYYQPNRDNAGYGADSRRKPSAVVALIFAIPQRNLAITGKQLR